MPGKSKDELYQQVTDRIVEALEAGANGSKWSAPWHASAATFLPVNATTHKLYRGINTLILWSEQADKGYASAEWATYKQWKAIGAQVGRVEDVGHGTTIFFWKPVSKTEQNEHGTSERKRFLIAKQYTVFNAAQVVSGYDPVVIEPKPFEGVEHAERFFASLGAEIRHGGNRASYFPAGDFINLPLPGDFVDNVSYYATSAHEHTHWTGHKSRCDRDLSVRFGDAQYAAEELVAELGSAYVCGLLGLANEPREDHAEYIGSWIKLLKDDPSAIVTAASKAQQAVDWLVEHADKSVLALDDENEEVSA